MVVAAAVQKYYPSRRDVRITKDVRAFTVLTSCASDLDVIGDFVFLANTVKKQEVPLLVRHVQFLFCMLGLVIWTILASDGRVAKPIFRRLKIPFVSTGHLLLTAVFLEDIPQVVISFLVEYVYTSDEGMSNWAVFNLMTAGYDMLIKLSEAYDERGDVLDTGAHLTAYRGHRAPVTSIALTEDGGGDGGTQRRLITGSYDNTAKVWEIETGRCIRTLRGHGDVVSSLATGFGNGSGTPDGSFSATTTKAASSNSSRSSGDGSRGGGGGGGGVGVGVGFLEAHANTVVTASHDKTLRAWDVDTGEILATFAGHTNEVTSVARIDPSTFVSGSTDKTVKLWRYGTATCLRTYGGHACRVNCVANVGGKLFLSGSSDKTARLWTTRNGACLRVFAGHHRSVLGVAALDGKTFVTGSADDTVRLWDLESQPHPKTGTVPSACTFHGHECQVFSVSAVDPQTFLSAGGDGRVKMWDAATGECVKTFESHGVWVLAVGHVDSRTFVTASWDHTAKRWATSAPGELVKKGFVPLEEPFVALSSTKVMKSVRSLRFSMTAPGRAATDVRDVERA